MMSDDKDVPTTDETAEMVELEKLVRSKDDKAAVGKQTGEDGASACPAS